MIEFESIGCISKTTINNVVIGRQIDALTDGMMPLYGATCGDMGFETFFMTVNFN